MAARVQYKIAFLTYKILHGLAPQYFGPLNYVADVPGRRLLRSATANRLAMPPVNRRQPTGLAGCRPTDVERPARRHDVCRVVIHLPSVTRNSSVHQILFLIISQTGLHLTSLSSRLYVKNPGLIG